MALTVCTLGEVEGENPLLGVKNSDDKIEPNNKYDNSNGVIENKNYVESSASSSREDLTPSFPSEENKQAMLNEGGRIEPQNSAKDAALSSESLVKLTELSPQVDTMGTTLEGHSQEKKDANVNENLRRRYEQASSFLVPHISTAPAQILQEYCKKAEKQPHVQNLDAGMAERNVLTARNNSDFAGKEELSIDKATQLLQSRSEADGEHEVDASGKYIIAFVDLNEAQQREEETKKEGQILHAIEQNEKDEGMLDPNKHQNLTQESKNEAKLSLHSFNDKLEFDVALDNEDMDINGYGGGVDQHHRDEAQREERCTKETKDEKLVEEVQQEESLNVEETKIKESKYETFQLAEWLFQGESGVALLEDSEIENFEEELASEVNHDEEKKAENEDHEDEQNTADDNFYQANVFLDLNKLASETLTEVLPEGLRIDTHVIDSNYNEAELEKIESDLLMNHESCKDCSNENYEKKQFESCEAQIKPMQDTQEKPAEANIKVATDTFLAEGFSNNALQRLHNECILPSMANELQLRDNFNPSKTREETLIDFPYGSDVDSARLNRDISLPAIASHHFLNDMSEVIKLSKFVMEDYAKYRQEAQQPDKQIDLPASSDLCEGKIHASTALNGKNMDISGFLKCDKTTDSEKKKLEAGAAEAKFFSNFVLSETVCSEAKSKVNETSDISNVHEAEKESFNVANYSISNAVNTTETSQPLAGGLSPQNFMVSGQEVSDIAEPIVLQGLTSKNERSKWFVADSLKYQEKYLGTAIKFTQRSFSKTGSTDLEDIIQAGNFANSLGSSAVTSSEDTKKLSLNEKHLQSLFETAEPYTKHSINSAVSDGLPIRPLKVDDCAKDTGKKGFEMCLSGNLPPEDSYLKQNPSSTLLPGPSVSQSSMSSKKIKEAPSEDAGLKLGSILYPLKPENAAFSCESANSKDAETRVNILKQANKMLQSPSCDKSIITTQKPCKSEQFKNITATSSSLGSCNAPWEKNLGWSLQPCDCFDAEIEFHKEYNRILYQIMSNQLEASHQEWSPLEVATIKELSCSELRTSESQQASKSGSSKSLPVRESAYMEECIPEEKLCLEEKTVISPLLCDISNNLLLEERQDDSFASYSASLEQKDSNFQANSQCSDAHDTSFTPKEMSDGSSRTRRNNFLPLTSVNLPTASLSSSMACLESCVFSQLDATPLLAAYTNHTSHPSRQLQFKSVGVQTPPFNPSVSASYYIAEDTAQPMFKTEDDTNLNFQLQTPLHVDIKESFAPYNMVHESHEHIADANTHSFANKAMLAQHSKNITPSPIDSYSNGPSSLPRKNGSAVVSEENGMQIKTTIRDHDMYSSGKKQKAFNQQPPYIYNPATITPGQSPALSDIPFFPHSGEILAGNYSSGGLPIEPVSIFPARTNSAIKNPFDDSDNHAGAPRQPKLYYPCGILPVPSHNNPFTKDILPYFSRNFFSETQARGYLRQPFYQSFLPLTALRQLKAVADCIPISCILAEAQDLPHHDGDDGTVFWHQPRHTIYLDKREEASYSDELSKQKYQGRYSCSSISRSNPLLSSTLPNFGNTHNFSRFKSPQVNQLMQARRGNLTIEMNSIQSKQIEKGLKQSANTSQGFEPNSAQKIEISHIEESSLCDFNNKPHHKWYCNPMKQSIEFHNIVDERKGRKVSACSSHFETKNMKDSGRRPSDLCQARYWNHEDRRCFSFQKIPHPKSNANLRPRSEPTLPIQARKCGHKNKIPRTKENFFLLNQAPMPLQNTYNGKRLYHKVEQKADKNTMESFSTHLNGKEKNHLRGNKMRPSVKTGNKCGYAEGVPLLAMGSTYVGSSFLAESCGYALKNHSDSYQYNYTCRNSNNLEKYRNHSHFFKEHYMHDPYLQEGKLISHRKPGRNKDMQALNCADPPRRKMDRYLAAENIHKIQNQAEAQNLDEIDEFFSRYNAKGKTVEAMPYRKNDNLKMENSRGLYTKLYRTKAEDDEESQLHYGASCRQNSSCDTPKFSPSFSFFDMTNFDGVLKVEGWLWKAKSEKNRQKFCTFERLRRSLLNTQWIYCCANRRFFTLNFNLMALYYSYSEFSNWISMPIPFKEILRITLLECPVDNGEWLYGLEVLTTMKTFKLYSKTFHEIAVWKQAFGIAHSMCNPENVSSLAEFLSCLSKGEVALQRLTLSSASCNATPTTSSFQVPSRSHMMNMVRQSSIIEQIADVKSAKAKVGSRSSEIASALDERGISLDSEFLVVSDDAGIWRKGAIKSAYVKSGKMASLAASMASDTTKKLRKNISTKLWPTMKKYMQHLESAFSRLHITGATNSEDSKATESSSSMEAGLKSNFSGFSYNQVGTPAIANSLKDLIAKEMNERLKNPILKANNENSVVFPSLDTPIDTASRINETKANFRQGPVVQKLGPILEREWEAPPAVGDRLGQERVAILDEPSLAKILNEGETVQKTEKKGIELQHTHKVDAGKVPQKEDIATISQENINDDCVDVRNPKAGEEQLHNFQDTSSEEPKKKLKEKGLSDTSKQQMREDNSESIYRKKEKLDDSEEYALERNNHKVLMDDTERESGVSNALPEINTKNRSAAANCSARDSTKMPEDARPVSESFKIEACPAAIKETTNIQPEAALAAIEDAEERTESAIEDAEERTESAITTDAVLKENTKNFPAAQRYKETFQLEQAPKPSYHLSRLDGTLIFAARRSLNSVEEIPDHEVIMKEKLSSKPSATSAIGPHAKNLSKIKIRESPSATKLVKKCFSQPSNVKATRDVHKEEENFSATGSGSPNLIKLMNETAGMNLKDCAKLVCLAGIEYTSKGGQVCAKKYSQELKYNKQRNRSLPSTPVARHSSPAADAAGNSSVDNNIDFATSKEYSIPRANSNSITSQKDSANNLSSFAAPANMCPTRSIAKGCTKKQEAYSEDDDVMSTSSVGEESMENARFQSAEPLEAERGAPVNCASSEVETTPGVTEATNEKSCCYKKLYLQNLWNPIKSSEVGEATKSHGKEGSNSIISVVSRASRTSLDSTISASTDASSGSLLAENGKMKGGTRLKAVFRPLNQTNNGDSLGMNKKVSDLFSADAIANGMASGLMARKAMYMQETNCIADEPKICALHRFTLNQPTGDLISDKDSTSSIPECFSYYPSSFDFSGKGSPHAGVTVFGKSPKVQKDCVLLNKPASNEQFEIQTNHLSPQRRRVFNQNALI